MNSPKVSVIIPNYNYAKYIAKAIESVLSQTYQNLEIIVVDDGSKDDSLKVLETFGDKIRVVCQKKQGVSSARNHGVAVSSGEYVAFLDADDLWHQEKLQKQLDVFAEDNQIGLVHCQLREFNTETGDTIHLHLEGEKGWVADEILLFEKPVIIGPGSSILMIREAFDAVGGFDTTLKKASEDWDFCYRVARKYKVGFLREILVEYRNHGNNGHKNVENVELDMKNCFEKAFRTQDENILRLRRRAYGNLHTELCGMYFRKGSYGQFCKNMLKGLWLKPGNYTRFVIFPFRWLKWQFRREQ